MQSLKFLKNDTNELTYQTERDSQTQKTNLWLSKLKGMGVNQEFGINMYILSMYKIGNQEELTIQHRELYSIFSNNLYGKESEKEMNICICITE